MRKVFAPRVRFTPSRSQSAGSRRKWPGVRTSGQRYTATRRAGLGSNRSSLNAEIAGGISSVGRESGSHGRLALSTSSGYRTGEERRRNAGNPGQSPFRPSTRILASSCAEGETVHLTAALDDSRGVPRHDHRADVPRPTISRACHPIP